MSNKGKTNEQPTAEENKALATQQGGALVSVEMDDDDAGRGEEDISSSDLKIPFLNLLQSNSPQVASPIGQGGVPGAKAGMFVNSATTQLYEAPIPFIPCKKVAHVYIEFTPRNLGGGIVAVHEPDSDLVMKLTGGKRTFGKLANGITKRNDKGEPLDGTELIEVMTLGCLFLPRDASPFKALLSSKSTQITRYQGMMTRIDEMRYDVRGVSKKPAIYSHLWELGTTYEKNAKGQFYNYRFTLNAKDENGVEKPKQFSYLGNPPADPRFVEAKAFYEFLSGTKQKVDYAKSDAVGAEAEAPPM